MWKHQVWVLGEWPQVPTHLQNRPGDWSSTLGRHLAHTVGVKERQSSQSCGQVASGGEFRSPRGLKAFALRALHKGSSHRDSEGCVCSSRGLSSPPPPEMDTTALVDAARSSGLAGGGVYL